MLQRVRYVPRARMVRNAHGEGQRESCDFGRKCPNEEIIGIRVGKYGFL